MGKPHNEQLPVQHTASPMLYLDHPLLCQWAQKVPFSQAPASQRPLVYQEDHVCPLMLAMLVAGVPVMPAPGVRTDRVLAEAQHFKELNPNMDELWEEQLGNSGHH
ncbi:hypothetical protein SKAU_G00130150 [Synaphobranchus kaupii]|uniref:Uncharacterized protein n=1 Tax=Synaphobranchus kaupii TaxID=118154 RepID=A0A9Q1FQM9_SYNKA|nr:hypothetical protein SKAU_G00130150 [Synaphobranchus kaupii]